MLYSPPLKMNSWTAAASVFADMCVQILRFLQVEDERVTWVNDRDNNSIINSVAPVKAPVVAYMRMFVYQSRGTHQLTSTNASRGNICVQYPPENINKCLLWLTKQDTHRVTVMRPNIALLKHSFIRRGTLSIWLNIVGVLYLNLYHTSIYPHTRIYL